MLSKLERRSFRAALSVLFLDNLGLSVIFPIFTPLILKPIYSMLPPEYPLSLRILLLGFLIAAFPLMQFFGAPVLGHISDKHGRRSAFLIALVGEGIGFLLTGIAIEIRSYEFLVFSRLFTGFFAGNFLICLSTIADISPDLKSRSRNFGTVSSVAGIAFVIAIALGGVFSNTALSHVFTSSLPFWIIAGLALINIVIISRSFQETAQKPPSSLCFFRAQLEEMGNILKSKDLRVLYPLFFFFMMGWIVSLQFLSVFLIEHFFGTKEMITILFVSIGVAWTVSTMLINRLLIKMISPYRILVVSLFLATACLFAASEVRQYYLFYHFILFGAIFASLVWINSLALISIRAPSYFQGKLLGINQSVATLAMTIAPFFGGFLGEYDIRTIYLFASCSLLASCILVLLFKNKTKNSF